MTSSGLFLKIGWEFCKCLLSDRNYKTR